MKSRQRKTKRGEREKRREEQLNKTVPKVRQANKRSIQARGSATQHRRSKEEQRCQSRRTHAWAMGRSRRFTDRSTPPRASVSRRGEGLFRLDRRGRTSARCAKAGRALRGCIDQSRTGSDLHTIAAQVRCRGLWLYQRRSSRIRTAQEPRKKKARPAASKCYWVRLYRVQSYGGLPSFEQYQSSNGDWVICERDMFPEHALAPLHSAPLAPCSCWRYARRVPAWTTTVVAADPAACRYGTIHTFASIVSCQPQLGASPSSRHFRR
jgi:hypothetical protein